MKTIALGDTTISRIVELEVPYLPASVLFPDSTPEALNSHREWLEPRFLTKEEMFVLSFHTYVVRTGHHTILVDTCIGNDKHRPDYPGFHMRDGSYLKDLTHYGVAPEDVDFVMCTHLHVDHVGWNTRLQDGKWVPTFPNAKYLFARKEWEFWKKELETNGSNLEDDSIADSVVPIVEAGAAVLVETDYAIDDEVWLTPSPGHTPGHYCVHLAGGGDEAVMTGDVLHSPVQCAEPDWNSTFCVLADQARATRRGLLEKYADTNVTILPAHFPTPTIGRFIGAGDTWRYQMLED
ncbi:MAG: MBL fold metallo-hydrolase [Gammaproteobacteria bacterium]|nr:MBL fold metallo-hydrolase [Gammaproteobacteria bacterium]